MNTCWENFINHVLFYILADICLPCNWTVCKSGYSLWNYC